MMTNGDREGSIVLLHSSINNTFLFLLTSKYNICIISKRLPEVPEYTKMRHNKVTSL